MMRHSDGMVLLPGVRGTTGSSSPWSRRTSQDGDRRSHDDIREGRVGVIGQGADAAAEEEGGGGSSRTSTSWCVWAFFRHVRLSIHSQPFGYDLEEHPFIVQLSGLSLLRQMAKIM